jgi:alpha-glucosidase (family GH31 glycosyl hydrolase)
MVNKIFAIILLTTVSFSCFAQNAKAQPLSQQYNGKTLTVGSSMGNIYITPYTADVIHVTYKVSEPGLPKSYSTIANPGVVKAKCIAGARYVSLQTSALKVLVDKKDFSISFIDNKGDTLSRSLDYRKMGDSSAISFRSDGKEAFYGGGSKAIELNRRGQILQNYDQAHWDYKYGQTDLNIAIPFFISNRGYGIYIDNAAKATFDVCKTDSKLLTYKSTTGPMNFFFVGGGNMDAINDVVLVP